LKRKSRTKRTGKVRRRSPRVVGVMKRKRVKRVVKKAVARTRRGKSRWGKGKLRIRKGSIRHRGRTNRKSATATESYQSGFNESYNNGYNEGFSKGFEEGHQLAYEQQI
jgi:flagellar biosynthesis/type III secretory pathway protein FliH